MEKLALKHGFLKGRLLGIHLSKEPSAKLVRKEDHVVGLAQEDVVEISPEERIIRVGANPKSTSIL
jgi:hypothetical protein